MKMVRMRAAGVTALLAAALVFSTSASAQAQTVAADMRALNDAARGSSLARAAQALQAARGPARPDGLEISTVSYASDPAQQARLYIPPASQHGPRAPLIVYFHDGWTNGALDDVDAACRALAQRLDAVVVSVDYRHSPAHPFPSQRADANYAWDWAMRNAPRWHADRSKTAIAGEGEGADLALMVAVRAKSAPVAKPSALLLIDPVAKGGPSAADDGASPNLDGLVFSGLHPVTIINAGAGKGLADGAALESALRSSGVAVQRQVIPGVTEGFFGYGPLVRGAYDAQAYAQDRLRRAFDIIYPGEPGSFTKAPAAAQPISTR